MVVASRDSRAGKQSIRELQAIWETSGHSEVLSTGTATVTMGARANSTPRLHTAIVRGFSLATSMRVTLEILD